MSYHPDPQHPLSSGISYFPPHEQEWLKHEMVDILNGRLSMGYRVEKFEKEFARLCGSQFAVAFPSGTSALETALSVLGVKAGDEILIPVQTFIATGMAIHFAGARPVFTEIDPHNFCMDFDDAWKRVTKKTKGAIVVHFGGYLSPELPQFIEKMKASGRFVIEDAAHAPGAEFKDQKAGSFGDVGCFSFYPTKVLTTGEGGMIVTSQERVAREARSLQNRGLDLESEEEIYQLPGRNNRMTEIAASMGLSQLRSLPQFLENRRKIAAYYDQAFRKHDLLRPLTPGAGSQSSNWLYIAILDEKVDRLQLRECLKKDDIHISWVYEPLLHLQPVCQKLFQTKPGMFPVSEKIGQYHICLPVHARLREEDAAYVVERIKFHLK